MVDETEVTILGYTGAGGDITIPSEIEGLPVTSIADEAFYGNMDFAGKLTMPSSLRSIGNYAFAYSGGLSGDLVIPEGVISIGESAFESCDLDVKLTLPSTLKTIGQAAFSSCRLLRGDVVIPESVISIGQNAFNACALSTVTFMGNAPMMGDRVFPSMPRHFVVYYMPGKTGFSTPSWEGVYCWEWDENAGTTNWQYTIENGRATITGFVGPIANPVIPDSIGGCPVTAIGEKAFFARAEITGTVTFPNTIESIGGYAFNGCSAPSGTLNLPSSLKTIGDAAFWGCSLRGDLIIPEGVTSIGANAFHECSLMWGALILPSTLETIGSSAFKWCYGFSGDLVIPEGVTAIGTDAFAHCSGFDGTLTLPSTLSEIGDYAFWCCSKLTGDLVIPAGVTVLKSDAFGVCTSLSSAIFEGDAPEFGENSPFKRMGYGFMVLYRERSRGYTMLDWFGYPCEMIPNRAPSFRIIGDKTIVAGQTVTFEVIADDEDEGDVLQYSASSPEDL